MNILQINSSIRAGGSHSSALATDLVARLHAAQPAATLVHRDLGHTPHPMLDAAALTALFTAPAERDAAQAAGQLSPAKTGGGGQPDRRR